MNGERRGWKGGVDDSNIFRMSRVHLTMSDETYPETLPIRGSIAEFVRIPPNSSQRGVAPRARADSNSSDVITA
jgi:hypothetical protein